MYLGSWGLVAPIITSRFLQYDCLFWLGAIRANNLGPLPFHVHLKWVHDLLPLVVQVFISLFEQLLERKTNRVQENILENVHEHSFFSIISELFSNYRCIQLRSCVGPSLSAWHFAHPVIPSFKMTSNIFFNIMHHIGPPPSHSSWSFFMHMQSCHKFDTDTPTLLCSWGRAHDHTRCSSRFVHFYC